MWRLSMLLLAGCGRFGFGDANTSADSGGIVDTPQSDALFDVGAQGVSMCMGTMVVSDDFEDGIAGASWSTFSDNTLTPTETGGTLRIDLSGTHGGGQYAGYESTPTSPFTNGCVVAELLEAPSAAGARAYLRVGRSGYKVTFMIDSTTIRAVFDDGAASILGTLTYVPANHRFVRVRRDLGTWRFELSGDGTTFSEMANTAAPVLPSNSTVELGAETTAAISDGGAIAWGAVSATN